MSGICGAIGLSGLPSDVANVDRMTSWLARRSPDGRATWRGPCAAMGHALLDTTDGRVRDEQPCTLEGRCWIVADARLDGRTELLAALAAAGETAARTATDAQLLLHAWRAWGVRCAERVLGDFAFAIWDGERRTLFCARDRLGVKPFFHGMANDTFVFASAIDCLRREGGVPDTLDDVAIADFLLFEMTQEPGATVFASIRRLPPAHCLAFDERGLRVRRYWQLAPSRIASSRRDGEWLEEFDAVLGRAVSDRLTSSKVAILMSGGLDSPALAAMAVRSGAEARAFGSVYDRIIPDQERHYSTVAAHALGIPISHRPCDDYGLFERYRELAFHFPEPATAPFVAADLDFYADAASHSRVALTGWDADALLSESPRPYLKTLARRGEWRTLARVATRFAYEHPVRVSHSLWLRMRGRARVAPASHPYPRWLAADFSARMRLEERWRYVMNEPVKGDAVRPTAHRKFDLHANLGNFFEGMDPSRTGLALEMRHPFFDLRVIELCMSLPVVPWCLSKAILRKWLEGWVPEEIHRRPKTPLAGFPHLVAPVRPGCLSWREFTPCAAAEAYLDRGKMASMRAETDPAISWVNLRAPALDLWLRHARTA